MIVLLSIVAALGWIFALVFYTMYKAAELVAIDLQNKINQ